MVLIDRLCELIAKNLEATGMRMELLLPYDKANLPSKIRDTGKIFAREYRDNGIYLDCYVDKALISQLGQYIFEKQ